MNASVQICIMAGGAGTRFWPLSTERRPKQFIDVLGTGSTLLQLTFERACLLTAPEHIWVLTHESYRDLVLEQLPRMDPAKVLLEPERRNTAPAIAYAAFRIQAEAPDAVMAVLSSDHLILREAAFVQAMESAIRFASGQDALVTLGIRPHQPHTGYGYIEYDTGSVRDDTHRVFRFVEKPDIDTARGFLATGRFLWNAGIFVWRVRTILQELQIHSPDLYAAWSAIVPVLGQPGEPAAAGNVFHHCTAASIDYAVMEKSSCVYTVPADIGWTDLGTWSSLYEQCPERDESGNAVRSTGRVVLHDVQDSVVRLLCGKQAIIRGLSGYVVADEEEGLLIYPLRDEQQIKEDLRRLD